MVSGLVASMLLLGVSHGVAQNVLNETIAPDGSVDQKLVLTTSQKRAIYTAVIKDKSKSTPTPFEVSIGAAVPPAIELYELPTETAERNHTANLYKYILVQEQVVVVDPTKMRIVDVIHQ